MKFFYAIPIRVGESKEGSKTTAYPIKDYHSMFNVKQKPVNFPFHFVYKLMRKQRHTDAIAINHIWNTEMLRKKGTKEEKVVCK